MKIKLDVEHQSVGTDCEIELPMLTVLYGVNGAGKTHLLQAIQRFGIEVDQPRKPLGNRLEAFFEGLPRTQDFGSGTIQGFLSSQGNLANSLFNYFESRMDGRGAENPIYEPLRLEIVAGLSNEGDRPILEEVESFLSGRNFVEGNLGTEAASVSQIFFDYHAHSIITKHDEGLSDEEFIARFGPPPWELLREAIETLELPLEVNDPTDFKLRESFAARFTHKLLRMTMPVGGLSTGERGILSLAMLLYRSMSKGSFPNLILMDEPDAHLHPSFVSKMISFVSDVLVNRHGCHVIMTTHSPSTVALAPKGSLYEMLPNPARLRKSESLSQAVSSLTSGFLVAFPNTKCVFVEYLDDKLFYETAYDIHLNHRKTKNRCSLSFFPAVVTSIDSKGKPKPSGGGRTVVETRVEEFRISGLSAVVKGIVDQDGDTKNLTDVFEIPRYSIENYLTDPLLVHARLVFKENAPEIEGVSIALGEETQLLNCETKILQRIVDHYTSTIEPHLGKLPAKSKKRFDVEYYGGKVLKFPDWQRSFRGKDILSAYREEFGQHRLNMSELLHEFRRSKYVPTELSGVFEALVV